MRYIVENSLYNFEAWSGGKDMINDLQKLSSIDGYEDAFRIVEDYLDMADYNDEPMTETEINDFLWYEDNFIAQMFDFADYEEMYNFIKKNS